VSEKVAEESTFTVFVRDLKVLNAVSTLSFGFLSS
jgi:hypothetical protein